MSAAETNPQPVVEVASPATAGIAANPQPVVEADADMMRDHLTLLFGRVDDELPITGWVFLGQGHDPTLSDSGAVQYDRWTERAYSWPGQAKELLAAAVEADADLFVTPCRSHNPLRSGTRRKPMSTRWLWVDVDHPSASTDANAGELIAGGAVKVLSGSAPDRFHLYVELEEAIDAAAAVSLNRRLSEYLGGDPAVGGHGGYLRLAGSINRKPAARGADPAPVVLCPGNGAVFSVADLDELLPDVPPRPAGTVDVATPEALPEHLPKHLAELVAEPVAEGMDRSARTMALIGAAHDSGLSAGQALELALDHAPSVDKYGPRLPVEVARCWGKVNGPTDQSSDVTRTAEPTRRVETPPSDVLGECVAVFRSWLHLPDAAPLHAVLASIAANHFEGDPMWLLVVGPPSGGKTELLGAVARRPHVHPVATMTEAALLSGTPRKESKGAKGGLLREVGDFGVLLLKDFTSILAQNRDTRSQVLGALREIYDGSWTRHVGTDGGRTLHWEGKVGLVGGCTPALDRHHSVLSSLGDRFLLLRLPPVDAEEVGARAMSHLGHERQMRTELADAASRVLDNADLSVGTRTLDEVEHRRLLDLAIFAVRARSAVERDGYSAEVLSIPEPEGPPRFVLALRRLLGGLEAVGCTPAEAWHVLESVAVDSMPATRRRLLEHLIAGDGAQRTGALAAASDLPTKTAARHLEDLALLGLAERTKTSDAGNAPDVWSTSSFTDRYWPRSTPESPDALSDRLRSTPESPDVLRSSSASFHTLHTQEEESLAYSRRVDDTDLCAECGERPSGSFSDYCARCNADMAEATP